MSDEVLAPAITVLLLLSLFLWVPALHGCQSVLRRRALRRMEFTANPHWKDELTAMAERSQERDTAA
jgi:hypothetical protein